MTMNKRSMLATMMAAVGMTDGTSLSGRFKWKRRHPKGTLSSRHGGETYASSYDPGHKPNSRRDNHRVDVALRKTLVPRGQSWRSHKAFATSAA